MFRHKPATPTLHLVWNLTAFLGVRRTLPKFFGIFFLLGFAAAPLRAQNYLQQTGAPRFTTAQPVELGFINLANGNLHQEIPLASFPQRGTRPFAAALLYDSRIWQIIGGAWQPTNVANSQGGWRFMTSAATGSVSYTTSIVQCNPDPPFHHYYDYYNFAWTAPDGTVHTFPGAETIKDTSVGKLCGGDFPNSDAFADDATGYHIYVTNFTSATVYGPDGTQVFPNVKGTNGNYFDSQDTLGRTPVTVTTNCNGNPNQTCYQVLNSQNNTSTKYTVTTTTINVNTAFGQSGVTEYSGTLTVIQSIQLPDNTTYQFSYDSGTSAGHYGVLSGVTLPTGGQITYGYTIFQDSFGNKNSWVSSRTSGGGTWSYTPSIITTCAPGAVNCQQSVTVNKPSVDNTIYTFTLNNGAWQSQAQFYTGAVLPANLIGTSSSTWDFTQPCSPTPCTGASHIRILRTMTTLPTPAGNNVTNKTEMTYVDVNTSNLASVKEWKFYAGASPTFPSAPDRETDLTYLATSPYTAKNILNRVLSTTVKDGAGTAIAQTNYTYDSTALTSVTGFTHHDDTNFGTSNTTRGNPTQIQRCIVASPSCSSSLTSTMTYDTTGQLQSVQDPKGNIISFSYTDNYFTDNGSTPPATFAPAAPTNAYLTQVTLPVSGTLSLGYYFNSGKLTYARDQNSNDSYNHFQDSLDRLTLALGPLLSGNRPWTLIQYTQQTQVDSYLGIVDTTPTSGCSSCRHDQLLRDNLGRLSQQSLVNDPDGQTTATYTYDTTSRLIGVSNPARSVPGPTDGTDSIALDGLDRSTVLTHPDTTTGTTYFGSSVTTGGGISAQLCSSGTYGLGYPVLAVDEAAMKRQTWRDGLGRLIEVDEPDSSGNLTVATCYAYNLLNNVTQAVLGSQTRSFTYDGLGRATVATEPESGTTNLYYTTSGGALCSGNPDAVCRRTDARAITTTLGYDAGNRLISKTYSDTTPAVKYGYDGILLTGCATAPPTLTITNPNGHRTAMCDGSGATSWSYDAAGRVVTEKRTILGVTKTLSYAYNADGSLASITYPSGRVVSYTYSNAQRAISAIDSANGVNYAQNVTYAPHGAITSALHGKVNGGFNGITETYTFNNRLEPTAIKAISPTATILSLVPGFALPGGNNSSVASVGTADGRDPGRAQTYTYDTLNRIASAQSQATSGPACWGQTFNYDRWDNLLDMNLTKCSLPQLHVTVDPATNRITTSGYGYDTAGNMTNDGLNSYSWDAENELKSAVGVNYTYDGDRLRVAKSSGTLYWRSLTGQTLAETDLTGSTTNGQYFEYVFFARRRIARRDASGTVLYYFADQVSSTRVIFRSDNQTVCFDSDYTPFGYELPASGVTVTCPQNYKYTGYERDTETGLDYAIFRYYNTRTGRFMSPDPLSGSASNPQSLNRYSYVLNDPCSLVDPFGLTTCTFNVYIDNQVGLTPQQIDQIQNQIEQIFGQTDDGHNNWVNVDFVSDAKAADATLTLTNSAWWSPISWTTPLWDFSGYNALNRNVAYVDKVQNTLSKGAFSTDFINRFIGSIGAHELGHFFGLGHVGDVQNLMTKTPGLLGGSPGSFGLILTIEQIAELFKKCQELHPPKSCDSASCGGGGGNGGPAGGGDGGWIPVGIIGCSLAEGGGCAVGAFWVWWTLPTPRRK